MTVSAGHQANTRQNAVYEEEGMKATIIQGKSQEAAHRSQIRYVFQRVSHLYCLLKQTATLWS